MKTSGGRVLAIDFGSKRIGIAVSDESNTIAFGREALANDGIILKRIIDVISSNNVSGVVIGYPLGLKGQKTSQTIEVEKFESELKQSLGYSNLGRVRIIRWDERFTSKAAADSMIRSGMRKRRRRDKSNIDIISATLLLQSYLDSMRNTASLNISRD